MFSLIEKFYSSSPAKRLLTVVTWLLILAAASTAYSFINFFTIFNREMNRERKPENAIGFEKLHFRTYLNDRTKAALTSWITLKHLSEKLLKESPKAINSFVLDDSIASYDAQIIETIKSFNGLGWEHLSLFASSQLDPFENSLPENFRKIRNAARFLGLYHARFKELYPVENSAFIFETSLKLARMTDFSCPFLIGKLIAIAVDKIAVKAVHQLLEAGKLTAEETAQCISAVNLSLELDRSIAINFDNEFILFKFSYAFTFHRNAPLATWLLNTIFGDPIVVYQHLSKELLNVTDSNLVDQAIRHPVLKLGFPNFGKALLNYSKNLAMKAILMSELKASTGQATPVRDPFSCHPLKSLSRNGKQVYYSVGPDNADNKMQGDDITFFAND
ncbi:MAG: hypothetical protein BWY66_02724 [bacterium ADurb.Bin374]|nr:MAG: hypothetical protein BWY66_02724 [bacterium ADurb.Bin374]